MLLSLCFKLLSYNCLKLRLLTVNYNNFDCSIEDGFAQPKHLQLSVSLTVVLQILDIWFIFIRVYSWKCHFMLANILLTEKFDLHILILK